MKFGPINDRKELYQALSNKRREHAVSAKVEGLIFLDGLIHLDQLDEETTKHFFTLYKAFIKDNSTVLSESTASHIHNWIKHENVPSSVAAEMCAMTGEIRFNNEFAVASSPTLFINPLNVAGLMMRAEELELKTSSKFIMCDDNTKPNLPNRKSRIT